MNSRKAIHILSFILILTLCWTPYWSADASSARSIKGSASALQGNDGSLIWNTFLGTATGDDGYGIAIDSSENLYLAGRSDSSWGSPLNAHSIGSNYDAFVAKMDSNGALLWNTFMGDSGSDFGHRIALDASGNIYVTGSSTSSWGAPLRAFTSGTTNAFVAKFNSSGTLLWNTFFPVGSGLLGDLFGFAVDAAGNAVVSANSSASWGSPIRAFAGGRDASVIKLGTNGELKWNTFLGGSDSDDSYGLALDSTGNIYISGMSYASWGSPVHAYSGGLDTFVAKLDSNGALNWHTFLGGSGTDYGFGIAVDGSGNIYSTGYSTATWGSPLGPFNTSNETFVARLDGSGGLVWNTFAIGNGHGITTDRSGSIYISGTSGPSNAFAAKLDPNGTPVWSTLVGASGWTFGSNIAAGPSGNVYLIGFCEATWGTPLNAFTGGNDAFVAKLQGSGPLYVKANATGNNDGTSWTNAYTSLQSALTAANSGDQIWVAAGTYVPTADTDRTVSFALKDGVAIYGGFTGVPGTEGDFSQRDPAANVTTLSGDIGVVGDATDNSYHVVVGSGVSTTAVLDGFTITAGNANAAASDPNGYGNGGGMWIDGISHITVSAVTFSNNTAGFEGGGLADFGSTGSSLELTKVAFMGNTAFLGGGMVGGRNNMLTDVTFNGNTARAGGGMANGMGSHQLTNVTFSNNTATGTGTSTDDGGGGMYNCGSSPILIDVTFTNNTAAGYGGGIFNYRDILQHGSNPTLTNVTFSGNTASKGGGMYNDNSSTATLVNVAFNTNTASLWGGGMYNAGTAGPTLTNVTFGSNSAAMAGGMFNDASNPQLDHVTFNGNIAQTGGAMVNAYNSNPTLTSVTVSNNKSSGDPSYGGGGGMYNYGSSPILIDVIFTNNTAQTGGGMSNDADPINKRTSNPTLTNVTFTGNTATSTNSLYGGGGMHNDFNSSPTLVNVTFTGNSAITGGGMHNDRGSSPTLTDVIFTNNTASQDGGGMSNHSSSNPQLTNVIFNGNRTNVIGGGLLNDNSNPALINVTFSANTAQAGGGLFNSASSPQLTNVTFSSNTASGTNAYDGGGGIYNDSSSTPTLNNVTFTGNTATAWGGGAMRNHSGSIPRISNSIFWGDGTVEIANTETSAPTIKDSIVQGGCPTGSVCMHVLNADPKLGPLQNNGGFTQTRALLPGSAAIDAGGVNVPCAATDQRGVTRPQGAACDMGAFELTFLTISGNAGTAGATLAYAGGSTSSDQTGLYSFSVPYGWSGTVTPSKAGYTFAPTHLDYDTVSKDWTDQNYTATALTYTLTITSAHGTVNRSTPGPYHYGDVVQLSAVPYTGWRFADWSGDLVSTANPASLSMTKNKAVTANYVQLPPAFLASPGSWNYGLVQTNTPSVVKIFVIKNNGGFRLTINTVALAGTNSGQFIISANSCSAASLLPGATCSVSVVFRPTSLGPKSAALWFTDNASGSPHKIWLGGRGAIELAFNGGFNTYPTTTAKIPTYWLATAFATTDGKDTVYRKEGIASVRIAYTSAVPKVLTQTRLLSGVAGNAFQLSVWGGGQDIPVTSGLVRVQVELYNGTTLVQTQVINFPNGSYAFTQKKFSFTALAAYDKIVIKLFYSKRSGVVWFDALSLLRSP